MIPVVTFMALSLRHTSCLCAPHRATYKGFFFVAVFLALPRILPSLGPFQLSPFSPSLTSGCTANTTGLTKTSSWVIPKVRTCTSYTLSCLHSLPAATSTIVWHPGTPALGIPKFFPWKESLFLNTLSLILLVLLTLVFFLKKQMECVQNELAWDSMIKRGAKLWKSIFKYPW